MANLQGFRVGSVAKVVSGCTFGDLWLVRGPHVCFLKPLPHIVILPAPAPVTIAIPIDSSELLKVECCHTSKEVLGMKGFLKVCKREQGGVAEGLALCHI